MNLNAYCWSHSWNIAQHQLLPPPLSPKKSGSFCLSNVQASYEGASDPNAAASMPNGRLIAVDARNTKTMKEVVRPWLECSASWSCIAPPGSTLANHLFDLSILALLLDVAKLPPVSKSKELGTLQYISTLYFVITGNKPKHAGGEQPTRWDKKVITLSWSLACCQESTHLMKPRIFSKSPSKICGVIWNLWIHRGRQLITQDSLISQK